jgi:hypothetical protein
VRVSSKVAWIRICGAGKVETVLKDKRAQQVSEVAGPYLQPGERVELVAFAGVGSVSAKRRAVTAAVTTVATAGLVTTFVRPRRMYIAMTQGRLLFFNGDTSFGKPGRSVLMNIPRRFIKVSQVKKGLITLKVELAIEGQDKGLKLVFPRPAREEGYKLAAEIPAAPQPA